MLTPNVVETSSLVSVFFREAFSHPYISFFHLLVIGFVLVVSVPFSTTLLPFTFLILMGGISGWGGIKMVSARAPSANKPVRTSF